MTGRNTKEPVVPFHLFRRSTTFIPSGIVTLDPVAHSMISSYRVNRFGQHVLEIGIDDEAVVHGSVLVAR